MIGDKYRLSDASMQSFQLQFSFIVSNEKLVIEAYSLNGREEYVGQIEANPYVNFQVIKQLIEDRQFKIVDRNETTLKVMVGATQIQLFAQAKSQMEALRRILKRSLQKQEHLQQRMKSQQDQAKQQKLLINKLIETVQGIKLKLNSQISPINDRHKEIRSGEQSWRFEQSLATRTTCLERLVESQREQIAKINARIGQISGFISGIGSFWGQNVGGVQHKLEGSVEEKRHFGNGHEQKNILQKDQSFQQLKNKLSNLKSIYKSTTNFGKSNPAISNSAIQPKQHLSSINQSSSQNEIPFHKKLSQSQILSNRQTTIPPFQQPLIKTVWSKQLKADNLKVFKNFLLRTSTSDFLEFGLLELSFSQQQKSRKSWAIKIKQMTVSIWLGLCFKNKIQQNHFNDRNIDLSKTNHGCYLINSSAFCFSHSQKDFNFVQKSFQFGQGDVIYCEYDPFEKVMRWRKNKDDDMFAMPIQLPSDNDVYHPCVGLCCDKDAVELII